MNDNEKWLLKNCTAFLDSNLDDVALVKKAGLIRGAAHKRGISDLEVSQMYQQINSERKNEKSS